VGTLITLGTSLFVSNKNTSLSLNSRAACFSTYKSCTTVKSTYTAGGYYSGGGKFYESINCIGEITIGVGNYCKNLNQSNPPPATLPACSFTLSQAATKCTEYTSDGCGKSVGKQTYKCVTGTTVPTAIPKPTTGTSYPEDDSCWLIKCIGGKPQKTMYTSSLSKYSMPESSCQGGSPYSGGGWMIIGTDNAEDKVNTFKCEGNVEITLVPTKTPTSTPNPGTLGALCKNLKKEDGIWQGTCNSTLTCDYKTGKCIKYTPPVATIPTLPTTNNTDDQKCIDRFQTANAYCGARPCTKKDNVGGKVVDYVSSNFLCASGFFGKEYVCCVRNDVNLNPTNAPTNKLLPTAIPNTGDAGDDKKCKDAFNTQYAFCTATACGPRKAVINGQSYSYKVQDYICNINNLTIATINFKCCVAEPFINNLTVVSNTTSVQTPVTTSGGEQGVLINLPGGTAFIKNSEL
ncbi:MAG: hypothetical protein NUV65_00100, partial [Candidatus Roizmanbacteria bacterium]|nr:hypothetical protein [Candidatus Roizmanbacteria bacterium]